jgi:hypothetical protein
MIGIIVYQYIDTCVDTRFSKKRVAGTRGIEKKRTRSPPMVGPSEHGPSAMIRR